jgi:hypothetical protein
VNNRNYQIISCRYYVQIVKAGDDATCEADVWKDGFFAMSRVYRYIAVCRQAQQNEVGMMLGETHTSMCAVCFEHCIGHNHYQRQGDPAARLHGTRNDR